MIIFDYKSPDITISGEDVETFRNVCLAAKKFIEDTPTDRVIATLGGGVERIVKVREFIRTVQSTSGISQLLENIEKLLENLPALRAAYMAMKHSPPTSEDLVKPFVEGIKEGNRSRLKKIKDSEK